MGHDLFDVDHLQSIHTQQIFDWFVLDHPIQSLDIFGSPVLAQNIPKPLRWEAEDIMWIAQVTEVSKNPQEPTAMCLAWTNYR